MAGRNGEAFNEQHGKRRLRRKTSSPVSRLGTRRDGEKWRNVITGRRGERRFRCGTGKVLPHKSGRAVVGRKSKAYNQTVRREALLPQPGKMLLPELERAVTGRNDEVYKRRARKKVLLP